MNNEQREHDMSEQRNDPPIRVIFLDFDGVLNNTAWLRAVPQHDEHGNFLQGIVYQPGENDYLMLDPATVARLARLVRETGAAVVVSSSWRWAHDATRLATFLEKRGFTGGVYDVTPKLPGERGEEIGAWLDAHPGVQGFVILDDCGGMGGLTHWLVRTAMATGLTDADVEAAKRLLNVRVGWPVVWPDKSGNGHHLVSAYHALGAEEHQPRQR